MKFALLLFLALAPSFAAQFRAGAALADISPTNFPVIVNAMFTERSADKVVDPLHSRALVLDDGATRIAIAVVDTCMMPRDLIDKAKRLASAETKIPANHILISATHTHSAPSAMGCLGSRADTNYAAYLPGKIAESIIAANARLQPARIGHTVIEDWDHTFNRRWIRRPDRVMNDPFGEPTVRAHMHPGHQSPDVIGPSGPVDPALSIIAIETLDAKPLALLANYSQHYYESALLSSDYYGKFAAEIARLLNAPQNFVGIMSQGTSGDLMWMDYSAPRNQIGYEKYAREIADRVKAAYAKIEFKTSAPLRMAERKLELNYRVPNEKRLQWARDVAAKLGGKLPQTLPEIYALEAIYLHERPRTELILQALRIGDLGIAALPNEVYALTGLKLKAQSPFAATINIELANGAEGYIPPPEQHVLGGYTTWPARTAGLEVGAEPKIVDTLLSLLEEVAEKPRRPIISIHGPAAESVLESKPTAFWRFEEMSIPTAFDASGRSSNAAIEDGVALYLPGLGGVTNRAYHFAGGRVRSKAPLGKTYSAEFWFWNGLPNDARPVTGYLFSRGVDGDAEANGDHVGIGGTHIAGATGKLIFFNGNKRNEILIGKRVIPFREWHHVALVRAGDHVTVYLDGDKEIDGEIVSTVPPNAEVFIGGRIDRFAGLEGKMDEVALYDRALPHEELWDHFAAADMPALPAPASLAPVSAPLSPEESLKKIHVTPGFRVELGASEPAVLDPVAIDWDSTGRMWAVEMADYPLGMDGKGKPGGRVRILEDTDKDGRFEKGTIFADGLSFPTGLITWRDGVIVTAAPEIIFLRDANNDGKADDRRVLFSGFLEGNQQLRINGLRWGLDNWIYCAVGGHYRGYGAATKIKSFNGQEIALGSRDFRFKPDSGEFEPLSGPSQFGRNRDAFGHWFGTQNSNPLWHYVLEDRYLQRNPHVPTIDPVNQLFRRANPKVYPRSPQEKRFHSFEHAAHFTSACAGSIYLDELLFGPGAELQAFVCEPFHNLVQRQELLEDGVTFKARRAAAEQSSDFFASEDSWTRPVMTRTGPDGALYVVDMYRYMIEHPDWLPQEGRDELLPHYRLGDDKGRIYRVLPQDRRARPWPNLAKLSPAELVPLLASENGWLRDKAQQEILWRGNRGAVTNALFTLKKTPEARVHALWTLEGLNALPSWLVIGRLKDLDPAVRENALRAAEKFSDPAVINAALQLEDDPSPKVILQLASSIGAWKNTEAPGRALAAIARANQNDPYITAAAFSSAVPHAYAMVVSLGGNPAFAEPLQMLVLGLDRRDLADRLISPLVTSKNFEGFANFLTVLRRQNKTIGELARQSDDPFAKTLRASDELFELAKTRENDFGAALLLARNQPTASLGIEKLSAWLTPAESIENQRRAIDALAETGHDRARDSLLANWNARGPETKSAIVEAMLRREPWAFELLQKTTAADFDAARRARLLNHSSKRIRELARNIFAAHKTSTRAEAIKAFEPSLKLAGSAERGHAVFTQLCATCHQKNGEGREVGPDLKSVVEHAPEKLLANILDPSADIQPGFQAYTCQLASGEELYGAIASEAGASVIFKLPDGSARTILRREIVALRSSNLSLMPEGLETGLTHQNMADLIAFLRAR